jgi:hypothetical protein
MPVLYQGELEPSGGSLPVIVYRGLDSRCGICDSTQEDDHKLENGIPDGRSVSHRPHITLRSNGVSQNRLADSGWRLFLLDRCL